MTTPKHSTGPLHDILVVDLSRALAGPHATMILGDLGARVIKVEAPGHGDDTRGWGPPFVTPPTNTADVSTYFLSANRNKESLVLDFKDDSDRAVLLELIQRADVVVENFRPGVLDKLGLGIAALTAANPRLIVMSITGFGHDGPESHRAGYDQILQGEGGLMSLTGPNPQEPQKFGTPITDLVAGMHAAHGILAALHERNTTGRGTVVRTSLLAAAVGIHAFEGTRWTVAKEVGAAQGNHHSSIAPYGLFRCANGAVQIAVGSETLWNRFCTEFEIDPNAEGLSTNAERVTNRSSLIRIIEDLFADWKSAELIRTLQDAGIPSGRIRSIDEVYEWDQTLSQGLVVDVDHETLGPIQLPGPPLRFFDSTGEERPRIAHRAPPLLDADGPAIRSEMGQEP